MPKDDIGQTGYTFNKEELKEQRDLFAEIKKQQMELEMGSTRMNKSLVKQNQNFAEMLKKKRQIAGTKIGGQDFQDLAKAVNDLKDGSESISDAMEKQAAAIRDGKKDVAKVYGMEIKRLRVEDLKNRALAAADDLTGGMASKASEILQTFKELGPRIGAIAIGLMAVVAILKIASEQQKSIADQFGAIGVTRFRSELADVNEEFVALGMSASDAQSTISNLANNFGVAFSEADDLAKVVGEVSVATGLSLENTANLIGLLTEVKNLSAEQASSMIRSAQSLALANDVAPDKILEDVADNTELFAKFSKDGGTNIFRAAIQARKLGTSLDKVAGIAESMLDFQSSIENEMKASVVIGRQLNFQKARELFMNNQLEDGMKEVVKQLGSEAEFNEMNYYQREQIAAAIGTEASVLQKLISGEKEAATLQEKMNEQKITDLVSEEALTSLAKLVNEFKALGIQIANDVGPALLSIIKPFAYIISGLRKMKLLLPLVATLVGALVLKFVLGTAASIANSVATLKNLAAKRKAAMVERANAMATGVNTTATGVNTTTKSLNTYGTLSNTTATGVNTTSKGAQSVASGINTATTTANTVAKGANAVATRASTGATRMSILPTIAAAGATAVNAAANFFAGAAKGSKKTAGIGALILVPLAILAVLSMVGMIAAAGKAISGATKTGDLFSPAGGGERAVATPGGLHLMNDKDDIMAAPGLARYVAGGGGGGSRGTNTRRLEMKQGETNAKLDRVANVLESALAGPRPALARAMGSRLGDTMNNMS